MFQRYLYLCICYLIYLIQMKVLLLLPGTELQVPQNIVFHLILVHKGKVHPQQAEVAQGVPGRLRPRIFLTFGTTRVVGRQPYAPSAFTPGEIPGTHFQRLSPPQGTWFRRGEPRKKSSVTPSGIDPEKVRLVP